MLEFLMIESATDFWIFIAAFAAGGGGILWLTWKLIRRIVKGKSKGA